MYHSRGFRGSRRRSSPRNIVQSYKKIINTLSGGLGAGVENILVATGTDSVAAGQTSATDVAVPTGSIIKYFEIQYACSNLVSTPCYVNCTIQYLLDGQTVIDPFAVGGSPQRNQVLHMDLFAVGADQNSTHKFKFKVPAKFQRLREGMIWLLVVKNTASINRNCQIIYKFYR